MTSVTGERERCPYVGLQPFEEGDREYFFGRERDERVIISNLLAFPLTILYGASGVGKSSVLMAGVVPHLHRERPKTPVVVFRNWADRDFQRALARACVDAVWRSGVDQPKPAESLPFDEILRACSEAAHGTMLVILDQFEEYFLYHRQGDGSAAFEAQFARAVNREDVDVGFLIALRDDSLSKLDRFQARIPNLLSNRLRLEHLDAAGAAVAIREPLRVWNEKRAPGTPPISIEEELVGELLRQVHTGEVSAGRHGGSGGATVDEGRIEAPFLQLVMVRLWEEERAAGSGVLRRATLDRLQGANEIVRTHLDDAMARLDAASQAVCASFFDRLVTPSGGKVACNAADLTSWAGPLASHVPAVLESLTGAKNRILRTVGVPDDPDAVGYEIYHDVLAPAILDWRRRYIADEETRIAVAKARDETKKRALRRSVAAMTAMTSIAIVGWIWASWQEMLSEANRKAAESISISAFDPGRALSLALEAVEKTAPFGVKPTLAVHFGLDPTAAAEDALRQAIQASRLIWTLPVSERWVSDVAFSPDGSMLATADQEKTVRLWNIGNGRPGAALATLVHDKWVRDVEFLPDGKRVLTAAGENAYLWAVETPAAPLRAFPQSSLIYSALAVSKDGKRLATAGNGAEKGRVIKVWDLDAAEPEPVPLATFDVGGAWVMGLAFSPDGCALATACVERGGKERTSSSVWNLATGGEILRLPLREASDAVAFSPDGSTLVTASRDALVRIWQPAGQSMCSGWCKAAPAAPAGEVNVDPAAPATGGPVWNVRILAGHGDRVRNIDVSPDGSRIASAGGDFMAKIWDAATGENLLTLAGHESFVEAARFSPDGHAVATASRDGTVKLWNIESHYNTVTGIAFSPDGRTLATGSSDRTARIWDVSGASPVLRHTLRGHADQVYRLAFDRQGRRLATAGWDNAVRLWDVVTGTGIATLTDHADQLRGVAFSPDGTRLASVGADGYAWLYELGESDVRSSRSVLHDEEDRAQASAVAFHPRRDRWVTGGHDGKLQLWDFTARNIGSIGIPEAMRKQGIRFVDIAFAPDGATIAALARNTIYLWPESAFERPGSGPAASFPVDGADYCTALAYRPDGKQLAVGCNDPGVRLYDPSTRKLVKTITAHKNAVSDLAFSPDGSRLATASLDKTFHVSPLRFAELYRKARDLQAVTAAGTPAPSP